jgi:hypothetical protein
LRRRIILNQGQCEIMERERERGREREKKKEIFKEKQEKDR